MVYTTLHKCQPGLGDLTMHTLNIPDLLALIYHALVKAFSKSSSCIEVDAFFFFGLLPLHPTLRAHLLTKTSFFKGVYILFCVFSVCVFRDNKPP